MKKNCLLNPENIALVLTGTEKGPDFIDSIKKAGWVELRIDIFLKNYRHRDPIKWVKNIRLITPSKLIATIRWHRERQDKFFRIPENYRLQLYKDILPFVDFVDVEIRSRIAPLLIKEAKKKNKKIIASYHNFQTMPSEDILTHLCNQAKNLKADMVKIAVIAKEEKSLFRLITLINKQKKNIPMIVIPMGSNLLQRLVPLAFGCQFTYAAFNKKTGPGQPEIREII